MGQNDERNWGLGIGLIAGGVAANKDRAKLFAQLVKVKSIGGR